MSDDMTGLPPDLTDVEQYNEDVKGCAVIGAVCGIVIVLLTIAYVAI